MKISGYEKILLKDTIYRSFMNPTNSEDKVSYM